MRKLVLLSAAAAAATVGLAAASMPAEARRGGALPYWETFQTSRMERGYEGFVGGPGRRGVYCSYRREPNRKCWITPRGDERCRIVSWQLIQSCY